MKRLSPLTLIFALLSIFFFLLLIFLRIPFPFYPLMSVQDAIDIFTSLVLIPIYWLLLKRITRARNELRIETPFMILSAVWVLGQGMHLSANSINNLIGKLAENQVLDVTGSDIYVLTYFYDEHLSHYLWHIGVLGLAALLIYASWCQPALEKTDWRFVLPAAILYGFNYFCIFLEGQTLPIGIPFAMIITLLILIGSREKIGQQPVLAFFFVSCLFAALLFTGWGLYWGYFPQFSEAGLI